MKKGYIYLIHAQGTNRYKIGLTTRTVEERLAELNSSQSAFPLEVIASARYSNIVEVEKTLHEKYRHNRAHGEWFEFSQHEINEVIRDIDGTESTGNPLITFIFALAIALLLAYCHQSQEIKEILDSPESIKIEQQKF